MGFQGDLDSVGLANIFQNLTANQQTGTLHVYDKDSDRYLVFSKGSIRAVSCGARKSVSLGEILIARGVIDEPTLADVSDREQADYAKLGQRLVTSGACEQGDVDNAMRFQMEEEIYDLFIWTGAHFTFEESSRDTTSIPKQVGTSQVTINSNSVLLEAMRRIDEWERLREVVPSTGVVPLFTEDGKLEQKLSEQDKYILSFIDSQHDVEGIIRQSCLGRYAVTELLARLINSGDVRIASYEETRSTADNLAKAGDKLETAARIYRYLVETDRTNMAVRQSLGKVLGKCNKPGEAADVFSRLAERLCEAGDTDKAIDAATRASEFVPDDHTALERVANLYNLADKLRESTDMWLKALNLMERKGRISEAIEKSEAVMQDAPDNTDLMQFRARLLIEERRLDEALELYSKLAGIHKSRGNIPAAIKTYRIILKYDTENEHARKMVFILQQTASSRRRKLIRIAVIGGFFLLFAAVAGFVTYNQFNVKANADIALTQVSRMLKKVDGQSTAGKLKIYDEALAILKAARPSFTLSDTGLGKQIVNIENLREAIQGDMVAVEDKQRAVLEIWKQIKQPDSDDGRQAFKDLKDLSQLTPVTSLVSEAKELVKKHEGKLSKQQDLVEALIKIVADKGQTGAKRFEAYRKIISSSPSALKRKYPEGIVGVSLPVEIETVAENGEYVPMYISVLGKKLAQTTPCVIEMPCDPAANVYLMRRGFCDPINGRMKLPRLKEMKPKRRETVKRVALWTRKFSSALVSLPIYSKKNKAIYVATESGEVASVKLSGKVLWRNKPANKESSHHTYMLNKKDMLFYLGANGVMRAMSTRDGALKWGDKSSAGALAPLPCQGMITARLFVRDLADATEGDTLDIVVSTRSDPPIFAINGLNGKIHWPTSKQVSILQGIDGAPAGKVFHNGSHIYVMTEKGKLYALVDNGAMPTEIPTALQRNVDGSPLFVKKKNKVDIYAVETGGAIHSLRLNLSDTSKTVSNWQNAQNSFRRERLSSELVLADAYLYAGFSSGILARVNKTSGAYSFKRDRVSLGASAQGKMAATEGQIFALCNNRGQTMLAVVDSTDRRLGPLRSTFSASGTPGVGVTVVSTEKGKSLVLFTAGNTLYCIEEEYIKCKQ